MSTHRKIAAMIRSFSSPFTTSPSIHCSMRRLQRLSSHRIIAAAAAAVHRQIEMHEWTKMLPLRMLRHSIPWGFTKSSATLARLRCVLSCMVLARAVPTSGSPKWEMHWWRWKSATFCASTGRREVHCQSEFKFFFRLRCAMHSTLPGSFLLQLCTRRSQHSTHRQATCFSAQETQ